MSSAPSFLSSSSPSPSPSPSPHSASSSTRQEEEPVTFWQVLQEKRGLFVNLANTSVESSNYWDPVLEKSLKSFSKSYQEAYLAGNKYKFEVDKLKSEFTSGELSRHYSVPPRHLGEQPSFLNSEEIESFNAQLIEARNQYQQSLVKVDLSRLELIAKKAFAKATSISDSLYVSTVQALQQAAPSSDPPSVETQQKIEEALTLFFSSSAPKVVNDVHNLAERNLINLKESFEKLQSSRSKKREREEAEAIRRMETDTDAPQPPSSSSSSSSSAAPSSSSQRVRFAEPPSQLDSPSMSSKQIQKLIDKKFDQLLTVLSQREENSLKGRKGREKSPPPPSPSPSSPSVPHPSLSSQPRRGKGRKGNKRGGREDRARDKDTGGRKGTSTRPTPSPTRKPTYAAVAQGRAASTGSPSPPPLRRPTSQQGRGSQQQQQAAPRKNWPSHLQCSTCQGYGHPAKACPSNF